MKVSGFTFVRNALKYDYPVVEAIESILPICDEVVVAVGDSEDDTLGLIRRIPSEKVRIVETVWDDSLREGGRVLAIETDKAFQAIAPDADWAFYIQGDEVIHEKYLPAVKAAMEANLADRSVDGLLFDYLHFYGSYDFVGESYRWYRREIRVVRNDPAIFSYRDAQGFRKRPQEKLRVKQVAAAMHHYGWVKDPRAMQRKRLNFGRYWHADDVWDAHTSRIASVDTFDYSQIDALRRFEDTHPAVMEARIAQRNWTFDHDPSRNRFSLKDRVKRGVEKVTGWRPGEYKNYRIV